MKQQTTKTTIEKQQKQQIPCNQTNCFLKGKGCKECKSCKAQPNMINESCISCFNCENKEGQLRWNSGEHEGESDEKEIKAIIDELQLKKIKVKEIPLYVR